MVGAYGKLGGGALLATVGGFGFSFEAVRRPSGPASTRLVNHSRLGEALLELRDPPIRALFVSANNPAVTCPDAAAVRRGLMREDLFTVVHDPFVTDTARYADLVLPSTTYLETEDLFRAYGAYYVQFAPQAVPAQGEAWSNVRLAQELARRLGVRDAVFSMGTAGSGARGLRRRDGARRGHRSRRAQDGRADQGRSLSGRPAIRDAVGKARVLLGALASQGLAPMPDWHEDAEETTLGQRWPLRLLTAPGYFQSHTAFTGNQALRRREGAPVVILHPADAGRRGLQPGDGVELFNDLGTVSMRLRVSDEVAPGVVAGPGQRPAGEACRGPSISSAGTG